jgi:hypothetical protein
MPSKWTGKITGTQAEQGNTYVSFLDYRYNK